MNEFDVVIIGGGPSGSALGYLLLKQGVSCCIVERERFPRQKLCGGLLTEKAVTILQSIYGDVQLPVECTSSKVSLFWEAQKLSTVSTRTKLYLVERWKLDHFLISRYQQIGGTLFEQKRVKKIDQAAHEIELGSGETIRFRILVGADGANSVVRNLIAPTYKPNAICVEASVASDVISDEVCVFFTPCRSGYGWCFPKSDYYTVGMGGDARWNREIKEAFVHFAEQIGKPVDRQAIQGATVPFGQYVKTPYKGDILLIGDAAGLVDPITGEGLYFAFRSAASAAAAIQQRLNQNRAFETTYAKDIKEIHAILRNANRFNIIFFSNPVKKRLLPLLAGRTTLLQYYCEHVLANYDVSYLRFPIKYCLDRRNLKR